MNSKLYVNRRKISVFEAENCRAIYASLQKVFEDETISMHADEKVGRIAFVHTRKPELNQKITAEILRLGGVELP